MIGKLLKPFVPNPFARLLKRAKSGAKICILWNRGLGDIALGLYGLVHKIREHVPDAQILFVTREDLKEGFSLLDGVDAVVDPLMKRGTKYALKEGIQRLKLGLFDYVFEKADPTEWLKDQLGVLVPRMQWQERWDQLASRFNLPKDERYVGVHVQSETAHHYGYTKDWPLLKWEELFELMHHEGKGKVLLFGLKKEREFEEPNVIDLRGETSLLEMLSLIKCKCSHVVAPDSGVLSLMYYLDVEVPLKIVSLWADPNQGVLKHNVASPNTKLTHIPIHGEEESLEKLEPKAVFNALFGDRG